MRTKPKALIIGAGAVGRGLLAPKLIDAGFMVAFLDINTDIVNRLQNMKYYPLIGRGIFKWIGPVDASTYDYQKFIYKTSGFDYIFVSVKSNNLSTVASVVDQIIMFGVMSNPTIYIIENLNNAATKFSEMLNSDMQVLNGIANVIVPLSPHQEVDPTFTVYDPNMELVLEKASNAPFISTARYVTKKDFDFEWTLKLYLHCSVHAFVAFYGIRFGFEYIHEVVTSSPHDKIVHDFMILISKAILWAFPEREMEIKQRMQFEFKAMSDHLMMDDVFRVARDPERKLEPDDRLIGLIYLIQKALAVYTSNLNNAYEWLLRITNDAIRAADLTPNDVPNVINGWENEDLDLYEGVFRGLNDEWKREGFSNSSDC